MYSFNTKISFIIIYKFNTEIPYTYNKYRTSTNVIEENIKYRKQEEEK